MKNAGPYNGFLAAGLVWASLARDQAKSLPLFFLPCVILAGVHGALALPTTLTLHLHTIPGLIAFILCLLPNRPVTSDTKQE